MNQFKRICSSCLPAISTIILITIYLLSLRTRFLTRECVSCTVVLHCLKDILGIISVQVIVKATIALLSLDYVRATYHHDWQDLVFPALWLLLIYQVLINIDYAVDFRTALVISEHIGNIY